MYALSLCKPYLLQTTAGNLTFSVQSRTCTVQCTPAFPPTSWALLSRRDWLDDRRLRRHSNQGSSAK